MNRTKTIEATRSLWERILSLLEDDLAERRNGKVFVEVSEESGLCRKEIGELSGTEMRSLEPRLRVRVIDQLLERYLAEQGRVDLLKGRRPYTKGIGDLTPEDLPALIEAEREKAEEQHEEREREAFVREVQEDLNRLPAAQLLATRR